GLGEIPYTDLMRLASHYRFLFNPIRYTSLGLAVCEAMAVGLPVVGLATTEMVSVIDNGKSGYVYTDIDQCIESMRRLLADPVHARALGIRARWMAERRFSIERFGADWSAAIVEARALASPNTERRIGGVL
ncbi:MAG: glycosyltransferase, partial [Acidiferrobacteraceae bacterium]